MSESGDNKDQKQEDEARSAAPSEQAGAGEAQRSEDEELFAEFSELLDEGEHSGADAEAQSDSGADELAELDAFLDDFEQNIEGDAGKEASEEAEPERTATSEEEALEASMAAGTAPEESEVPQEQESEPAPDDADEPRRSVDEVLPDLDDLDLSSGEPEEESASETPTGSESAEPEPPPEAATTAEEEHSAEARMQDLFAAHPPREGKQPPGVSQEPVAAPRAGGIQNGAALRAVIALLVLALAGSGVAAWMAFGLAGQVEQLAAEVQERRPAGGGSPAATGALAPLRAELSRLDERVNELGVMLEGPISHIRESNRRELESIFSRLDALDERLSALQSGLEERPAPRPAAKSKPAAPAGGWVVNIASLSSADAAAAEARRLKAEGITVEIEAVTSGGKRWHRLYVPGFSSKEEATAYATSIKERLASGAWVQKK